MSLLLRLNLAPLKKLVPAFAAPFSTSVRQEKSAWKVKLSAEEKKEFRKRKEQAEVAKKLKALAPGFPRKAPNAYALYVKDNYTPKARETGKGTIHVTKVLAQEWSSMPDSQKQNYRQKAVNFKKQLQDSFKKWCDTLSDEERSLFSKKGEKYLTKAQRRAMSTIPLTAYQAFTKANIVSVQWDSPDTNESRKRQFAKLGKANAEKWNALSESQRQAYKSV